MASELELLVKHLFELGELGCQGVRNPDGADEIRCPSCGAWERIRGCACGTYHINSITHRPGCDLVRLNELAMNVVDDNS